MLILVNNMDAERVGMYVDVGLGNKLRITDVDREIFSSVFKLSKTFIAEVGSSSELFYMTVLLLDQRRKQLIKLHQHDPNETTNMKKKLFLSIQELKLKNNILKIRYDNIMKFFRSRSLTLRKSRSKVVPYILDLINNIDKLIKDYEKLNDR